MKSQLRVLSLFVMMFCFLGIGSNATVQLDSKESDQLAHFQSDNKKAQFPGGKDKLDRWLRDNMEYPEEAKRYGTVIVNFVVKKNGKLTNFVVQKGVEKYLDVVAIEILRGMPKWEPAMENGKAVDSMIQLPVKFVPQSRD